MSTTTDARFSVGRFDYDNEHDCPKIVLDGECSRDFFEEIDLRWEAIGQELDDTKTMLAMYDGDDLQQRLR